MNLEDAFHDDTQVTEALVDRYYDMIRREGVRGAMLKKMRAVTFARHEQVHCITQPTLVLWGTRDSWLPPRIGDWFRERIAGSKLIRLPEIGHDIPEEADPRRLARLMTDWLQSTPPAGATPEKGGDDECPDAALRGQAGLRDGLLRPEGSAG